ncbi:MAG: glycosyltransferase [Bacteroidota bacterium]
MKILVLLSRVPYPLDKGDKLRAFNQIRRLSEKHEIILCALNDTALHNEAVPVLKQYCSDIKIINLSRFYIFFYLIRVIFNGYPLQIGYFYSGNAQKQVDDLIAKHKPDHIYCQLIRTTEYVKKHKNIPKTLDYMDAFSKGTKRRIPTAPFYLKRLLKIESKRLAKYENEIFSFFRTKTIISEQDRDLINHPEKNDIIVIPNGVDTDYFQPKPTYGDNREKPDNIKWVVDVGNQRPETSNQRPEYDLLFTGNMNYPPNIDSVVYLVNKILPIVLKTHPEVKLLIAGTNPSKQVLKLRSGNVSVSGWVKDMRECYAMSRIFIAPMQIGIGMQNKILEAMSMQLPCITSPLANNAIKAVDGESILIGIDPGEYAGHVISLLDNCNKAKEIAINGYNFVCSTYNWDEVNNKLEQIISS